MQGVLDIQQSTRGNSESINLRIIHGLSSYDIHKKRCSRPCIAWCKACNFSTSSGILRIWRPGCGVKIHPTEALSRIVQLLLEVGSGPSAGPAQEQLHQLSPAVWLESEVCSVAHEKHEDRLQLQKLLQSWSSATSIQPVTRQRLETTFLSSLMASGIQNLTPQILRQGIPGI